MALWFSAKKATVNICGRSGSLYVTHAIAVFFLMCLTLSLTPPSSEEGRTDPAVIDSALEAVQEITCDPLNILWNKQHRQLEEPPSFSLSFLSASLLLWMQGKVVAGAAGERSVPGCSAPAGPCRAELHDECEALLAAGAGWPLLGWDKAAGYLQCWLDRAGSLCSSTAWPSQRNPWSVFGMTFEGSWVLQKLGKSPDAGKDGEQKYIKWGK